MTMTLVEQAGLAVRPDLRPDLQVATGDIEFWNAAPGEVVIEFTVRNHGEAGSEPTTARVQAAPLGAFVAWRELDDVVVPALDPGEEVTLRMRAVDETPPPLAMQPQRLTSGALLTALDLRDRRDRPEVTPGLPTILPPDPLRLLGRGSVYWAGNLNIFVGGKATERHTARALRVYPGRTNMAMFVVGRGPDSYSFSLEGAAADWETKLYNSLLAFGPNHNEAPIELGRWVRMQGATILMMATMPPADCREGAVEIHVTQKSTGRNAVVEFSLDARAQGPGCYVVE